MCPLLVAVGKRKRGCVRVFLLAALTLSAALSVDLALARLSAALAHPRWMMPVVSGVRIMAVVTLVVSGVQRRSARVPARVPRALAVTARG